MGAYKQLMHNLTNHPTNDVLTVERFELLRQCAKDLGAAILDFCPETRERSLALTKVEGTVMWAVASIARNQGS